MSLYRKHRPQAFEQIVGQEAIVQTLSNAVAASHIGHSYLFCGPRGTGKTSTARIIAKCLNCEQQDAKTSSPCNKCDSCQAIQNGSLTDILEIDAASNRGIDEVRQLKYNLQFPPSYAKTKVYIIDEVHMLTFEAFNALLKTLEEPPAYAYFILATTELHKVPATIQSRCQIFNFTELSQAQLAAHLSEVCKLEKIKYQMDALELIAKMANGGVRDSLTLLEKLLNLPEIDLANTSKLLGLNFMQDAKELAQAVLDQADQAVLAICQKHKGSGTDPKAFAKEVLANWQESLEKSILSSDSKQKLWISQLIAKFLEVEANLSHSYYYWLAFPILSSLAGSSEAPLVAAPEIAAKPKVPAQKLPEPVSAARPKVPAQKLPEPVSAAKPKVPAQKLPEPEIAAKPKVPAQKLPEPEIAAKPEVPAQKLPEPEIAAKPEVQPKPKIVSQSPAPIKETVEPELVARPRKHKSSLDQDDVQKMDDLIANFAAFKKSVASPKLKRLLDQAQPRRGESGLKLEMESDFFLKQIDSTATKTELAKMLQQQQLNVEIEFGLSSNAAMPAQKSNQKAAEVAEFFGGEIMED